MNFDSTSAVIGLFVAYFVIVLIFQISRKGMRGMFFGGKVIKQLGEITLNSTSFTSQKLNVYEVDKKNEKHLGFEMISKAPLAFGANYFSIPKSSTENLCRMIDELNQGT